MYVTCIFFYVHIMYSQIHTHAHTRTHTYTYRCIAPIEGIGMLIWWLVDEIINNSDPYYPNSPWWEFTPTSLISIVTQVCTYVQALWLLVCLLIMFYTFC